MMMMMMMMREREAAANKKANHWKRLPDILAISEQNS